MYKIIITCEHASNKIPAKYNKLFRFDTPLLNSHQGYDIGAVQIAKKIKKYADYHIFASYSRLLIDLNRSLHHPQLFTDMNQLLSRDKKNNIINDYYLPYRCAVENELNTYKKKNKKIFHLSVHSFTPILKMNSPRNCDIGILYDPRIKAEKNIAYKWKQYLLKLDPTLKIRFNYPYLGTADGFVTYLRKRFKNKYVGFELEVNQKYFIKNNHQSKKIINDITHSFQSLLHEINH
jgi:predicted N-formylglutamate amidohydrolase